MKSVILSTAILGLICGCVGQNNSGLGNSVSEANTGKTTKDTRGHRPRSMTAKRLKSIFDKYGNEKSQALSWNDFNDWRRNQFNTVDVNNNSIIDAEEYVYEFEGRLDIRLEEARKAQVDLAQVRFTSLDADASGLISWEEYAASGEKIFSRWDSNNDKMIDDKDEAAKTEHKKKQFSSGFSMPSSHNKKGLLALYDANLDEAVSADEFNNERRSTFHLADQDKNGALNQAEYQGEFEDRLTAALNKRRRASIKQTYVRFNVLDDNKNEEMTFAEFQISGKRIFDRWDKNEDGIISAADIKKTAES